MCIPLSFLFLTRTILKGLSSKINVWCLCVWSRVTNGVKKMWQVMMKWTFRYIWQLGLSVPLLHEETQHTFFFFLNSSGSCIYYTFNPVTKMKAGYITVHNNVTLAHLLLTNKCTEANRKCCLWQTSTMLVTRSKASALGSNRCQIFKWHSLCT